MNVVQQEEEQRNRPEPNNQALLDYISLYGLCNGCDENRLRVCHVIGFGMSEAK